MATSIDGTAFAPGTDHRAVLDVWAQEESERLIGEGDHFSVWMGGDVGEGTVITLG